MASDFQRRAGSCPRSCHELKPGHCAADRAQAGGEAARHSTHSPTSSPAGMAQLSQHNTCSSGSCSTGSHAPRQPGANLPLSLMWLGWHFPQHCQAMSPCLSGTREYLQAKLVGPHAGVSEAPVLLASCRVSRAGGSGKRDGLLSGCPHQGCSLVIRTGPHTRLHCRKFVLVTPFPTSLPSPCRLGRSQPWDMQRKEARRSRLPLPPSS